MRTIRSCHFEKLFSHLSYIKFIFLFFSFFVIDLSVAENKEVKIEPAQIELEKKIYYDYKLVGKRCRDEKSDRGGFQEGKLGECGRIRFASFHSRKFEETNLKGMNLYGSRFHGGEFKENNLTGAFLIAGLFKRTKFIGAKLHRSYLLGSRLIGAQFLSSDLTGADLSGAKGTRAVFKDSKLKDVKFVNGTCLYCRFENVDLSGADLTGTIFIKSKFEKVKVDSKTKLPFSKAEAIKRGMNYFE